MPHPVARRDKCPRRGGAVTPLQFIRDECANRQPDGSCTGAMIDDDLRIRLLRPLSRCLVADNRRCPYFEVCVAPMAGMVTEPRRAAPIQEAVAEYRRITKQGEDLTRQCPECGGSMRRGKKYCPRCADARRKASNRAAQDRRRHTPVVLSADVGENTPKTPMILGGPMAVFENPIGDSHPSQNGQTSADIVARRAS